MKVCLYHEKGKLLSVSGIGNAFTNLEKAVKLNNIKYTTDPDDDYDILHLNFIGIQSLRLALKAKMDKKKIVIHTHMTKEDFMNSYVMSNLIASEIKFLLYNFYSMADCLISPSNYTKGIIRSYRIKNRIEVVSNGIDTKKFQPSKEKAAKFRKHYHITKPTVFSVGIPFKRKGIYDFIEISKGFPELDFYWVGKKFNRMILPDSRKAFEVESKNMQFTGFVEDIIEAYSAGDIFLFPSYEENQGIVILEAASMGKPILIRDIPVYKDWLFHGENCLKAKSNAEFVRNIQKVMDDKQLRRKLIRGSLKLAKENDLKIVGKRYKAIYQSLMVSKK